MKKIIPEPLFVMEMANNHMGDVSHGLKIISEMGKIVSKFPFPAAFKLQYRDLDTFIHPAMKGRDDIKYVKRFSETRLSEADFNVLINAMRENGFLTMATPFDEASVDLIEKQQLDFVKIASCSFTDWPLLERVVRSDLPIIASTAGARLEDIDRVVNFFLHRKKDICLLHCVGEYPTPDEHSNLSQIDFLKTRYPSIHIGFSTHENPDHYDNIKVAIAKGAVVFEKHVGMADKNIVLNNYSAAPQQVENWLRAAQGAWVLCGVGTQRTPSLPGETASLRSLRRGVFAKKHMRAGQTLHREDIFFAFPPADSQITANDWSKYVRCTAKVDIQADEAVTYDNARLVDQRDQILDIAHRAKQLLQEGGITYPGTTDLEISHHYGIDKFWEYGLTMLTIVNRAYCKKLLILFKGQKHPEQYHKEKEETFHVLHGTIFLELDGASRTCKPGDVVTIDPGVRHSFWSSDGAVIEEISSTHFLNDSYYTDPSIDVNQNRKTLLSYWLE